MGDGPIALFRARRSAGSLWHDSAQELAAEKLQSLYKALIHYERPAGQTGWRERLGLTRRREDPPQGLYIFGGVGRGKSMLMDLFFLAVPIERKRRVHFHAFMLEVHDSLHRHRQDYPAEGDALGPFAQRIANEAWLLCFDEFHVGNIADAMLLGRLFSSLFDLGVVVVATSNAAPDDLYEGGLQRERFLPFIALLKQRLDVLELDGAIDYRLARLKDMTVYHHPLGPNANQSLDQAFERLTDSASGPPTTFNVQGRQLTISAAAKGVARFQFGELCERPLGAADFIAIATHFHTVLLANVPCMRPEHRNEARRFMVLIDALYEHKSNLICSADALPAELYSAGEGSIEFQRTVSRLVEMQSSDYLRRPHLP
ncbi:MAG: cell division protein ZapE [Dongiaceae bacterium]